MAISADGERWFLVNASPDLRAQIESFEPLQPRADSPRNSPLEAVLLTNADLDHALGLFLIREGAEVVVHATAEVRETLGSALGLERVLGNYGGVRWHEPPEEFAPLLGRDGKDSGLRYRAIALPGNAPRYAGGAAVAQASGLPYRSASSLLPPCPSVAAHPSEKISPEGQSLAYEFCDDRDRHLLVAPDVSAITPELQRALERAELILFDGTFWSEDELRRVDPTARLASEMGHLPIEKSLPVLAALRGRKIYLHINNTNPVLREGSSERMAVEAMKVELGADGINAGF